MFLYKEPCVSLGNDHHILDISCDLVKVVMLKIILLGKDHVLDIVLIFLCEVGVCNTGNAVTHQEREVTKYW